MRKKNSFYPVETINFNGHPNVLGLHRNTIEITKDHEISKKADCIIGVNSTRACSDLNARMKNYIQSGGNLLFEIIVEDERFSFIGKGSRALELTSDRELVLRRSDFASGRTGAIKCEVAAIDLPRSLVKRLQHSNAIGTLKIIGDSNHVEDEDFIWSLP